MRLSTTIVIGAVATLVTGCPDPKPTPPVSRETPSVSDRIAVCNGGVTRVYGAEVSADLSRILEGQGELTGEVKEEIKGLFLSRENLGEESALAAYDKYLDCLAQERIFIEKQSQNRGDFGLTELQCRSFARCESGVMSKVKSCREVVQEEARSEREMAALYSEAC